MYLTAWQAVPLGASEYLASETWRLHGATAEALSRKGIRGKLDVRYYANQIVVYVYTPDADRAFTELAPVFREWKHCEDGFVLLRYGPPGARERQVALSAPGDDALMA